MKIESQDDAQRRIDQINSFTDEFALLSKEGILNLTSQQISTVATYHNEVIAKLSNEYDIDKNAKAKQLSLGLKIVSFLTTLALSASLFFWGLGVESIGYILVDTQKISFCLP